MNQKHLQQNKRSVTNVSSRLAICYDRRINEMFMYSTVLALLNAIFSRMLMLLCLYLQLGDWDERVPLGRYPTASGCLIHCLEGIYLSNYVIPPEDQMYDFPLYYVTLMDSPRRSSPPMCAERPALVVKMYNLKIHKILLMCLEDENGHISITNNDSQFSMGRPAVTGHSVLPLYYRLKPTRHIYYSMSMIARQLLPNLPFILCVYRLILNDYERSQYFTQQIPNVQFRGPSLKTFTVIRSLVEVPADIVNHLYRSQLLLKPVGHGTLHYIKVVALYFVNFEVVNNNFPT